MQSMKGATRIIGGMNRTMNLPALSKIAQDFERENDVMEQRQEMMEDAVDDALGDPAEEEESEETINQILDELGIEFNSKVSHLCVPSLVIVLTICSWVRHRVVFNQTPLPKAVWPRLLEEVVTMISKHDSQAYESDEVLFDSDTGSCMQKEVLR